MNQSTEQIISELQESGYQYGVAIATPEEVEAGSACGQLAVISDNN